MEREDSLLRLSHTMDLNTRITRLREMLRLERVEPYRVWEEQWEIPKQPSPQDDSLGSQDEEILVSSFHGAGTGHTGLVEGWKSLGIWWEAKEG